MSTHTPGPWHLSFNEEDDAHEISMATAIDNESSYRTQHLIKYSHGLYPNNKNAAQQSQFEEAEANARLIAAAPSLLETCKTLLKDCETSLRDAGGCDHSVGICMCSEIMNINEARAAIELATKGELK